MKIQFARMIVLGVGGLLCLAPLGQAAPLKSDTVVKAATNAGKEDKDGKQVIEVELAIDKGWHLYANPVGNPAFEETRVVVTASANGKEIDAMAEYPTGKLVKDSDTGDYRIYEGKVTVKLTVDRGKLGSGPIDLKVKVAACNDKTCLLPADIKLSVK